MIQQFTAFRASDGTTHATAYAAWKHELVVWLTHCADNEAVARKIVKAVDDGQPETFRELRTIVDGLAKHAPPAEIAAKAQDQAA